ncbi:MAG: S8 family serine peptidase [Verrucomicrobiota bacterium]|jgi:hypothetical protein
MKRARLSLALALLALPALAHKVQVNDPAVARALAAQGGRLIADYGGYQLFETPRTNGLVVRDIYNSILLNAGRLDTSQPQVQSLGRAAGSFPGKRLRLVHFAGPVQPAWRQALLDARLQIVSYIPHNAYLVYGDARAIAQVQSLSAAVAPIQWDGPFLDDYKSNFAARPAEAAPYAIQLVADATANAATLKLLEPPIQQRRVLQYLNVIARLKPADVKALAARPDVISIRPFLAPKKLCERQDQIVAGNLSGNVPSGPGYLAWLAGKGFTQEQFTASAFVVDVTDSGIDDGTTTPNHFGLYSEGETNAASRVVYSRLEGTPNAGSTLKGCDGHGTLNAHIIGGYDNASGYPFADNAGYHYGLGVCPFVQLGSSVIFDPDYPTGNLSFSQLQDQAYQDGARVSNNSWGYGNANGDYGIASQEFDALVRDAQPAGSPYPATGNQEMVIVFAAGNSGPGAQTPDEPATAKNVIAVGGADNVQPFGGYDECNIGDNQAGSANEILDISSRGPCADGRHKPDLVAPSTHVSGGVVQAGDPGSFGTADSCYNGDSVCGGVGSTYYPPGQQFYTASSGTSHSTACVAGGCALLRQYFLNQSFLPPSPAMTKAWLMNSARYLTGVTANDTLWSDAQGMGELDLGAAFDGVPRIVRDQLGVDTFTESGQTRAFSGSVADTNLPFRVTVAWTDAPGSTIGAAYNNDLDLTVSIGGQTYLGNVFSNAWSAAGGAPDPANNVESVFLPPGAAGNFTVTVAATSLNSIGVPNGSNGLAQDFALVIDNAAGAGPPVIVPAGAVVAAENCLPANGLIDPGETVTVRFALQNLGTVNTTNLAATLLSGGGVLSPGGPVACGVLPAGGAPVEAAFSFTAGGECGGTLTATLQLQDGPASLGSVNFTFPLGQFVPLIDLTQNFDAVTPPALPSGWTTAVTGGQIPWVTTNNSADSPPNSAFATAVTNAGIAELLSPSIPIATAAAQVVFRHSINLEINPYDMAEAFDGGVLEIQIGTNAFSDLLAAGGVFLTNGYAQTIASDTGNPLAGRAAWSGDSGGFITTVASLPAAAAGQNIQLKWRCATDIGNAYGSVGWWVDTIAVNDGGSNVCCNGPWAPTLANPLLLGGNFTFSFQTVSNQTYTVEYNNALTNAMWTPLQSFTGDGSVRVVTNGVASLQGYYRVASP